jgi:hypothetical protein
MAEPKAWPTKRRKEGTPNREVKPVTPNNRLRGDLDMAEHGAPHKENGWVKVWLRRLHLKKRLHSEKFETEGMRTVDFEVHVETPPMDVDASVTQFPQTLDVRTPDSESNVQESNVGVDISADNLQMKHTFHVLNNPSQARDFFDCLSKTPCPGMEDTSETPLSDLAQDNSSLSPPPDYHKSSEYEKHTANLGELEKRIEELAKNLEIAYARQQELDKMSVLVQAPTAARPSPSKDQISFLSCMSLLNFTNNRLVGL